MKRSERSEMKLSERVRGYIYGKRTTGRITRRITDEWAEQIAQLETESEIRKKWTEELSAVNLKWAKEMTRYSILLTGGD